jgi:hypothetical protein
MLLTIVAVIDIATLVSFTIEKNNNFPIFHGIGMFCWKKTLINLNFFLFAIFHRHCNLYERRKNSWLIHSLIIIQEFGWNCEKRNSDLFRVKISFTRFKNTFPAKDKKCNSVILFTNLENLQLFWEIQPLPTPFE